MTNKDVDITTLKGIMYKRGGSNKNWKQRYFQVADNKIWYYQDINKLENPLGFIEILKISKIENRPTEKGGNDFPFDLVTPERVFNIKSKDMKVRSTWITTLAKYLNLEGDSEEIIEFENTKKRFSIFNKEKSETRISVQDIKNPPSNVAKKITMNSPSPKQAIKQELMRKESVMNFVVEPNTTRQSEMKSPKFNELNEEKKKILSELTCAFLEFKRLELKTMIAKSEQEGYKVDEVQLLKNISSLTKKQSFLEGQIKLKEKKLFELELQTFTLGSQLGKTFEALQYNVNFMRENNIYPAARILEGLYKKMIDGPVEFSPQVIGFIENFRKVLPPLELSLQTKTVLTEQYSLLQKKSETLKQETDVLEKKFDSLSDSLKQWEEQKNTLQEFTLRTANITQTLRELDKKNLKEWMKKPESDNVLEILEQLSKQTEPLIKTEETSQLMDKVTNTNITQTLENTEGLVLEKGTVKALGHQKFLELIIAGTKIELETASELSLELIFLLNYKIFFKELELMERLILIYCTTPTTKNQDVNQFDKLLIPIRVRVLKIIKSWIQTHPYDFHNTNNTLYNLLTNFLDNTVTLTGYAPMATALKNNLENQNEYAYGQMDMPPSILPINFTSKFKLVDIDATEISRQITLIDQELYQALENREFLNMEWSSKDENISPHVKRMINHFNRLSALAVSSIVSCSVFEERVKLLEKWILVADELLKLRNFNGVMVIVSSLANVAVSRLKKTFGEISKEIQELNEKLSTLMAKNFSKLRKFMEEANAPAIPYIGAFVKDLTSVAELDTKMNGLWNLRKIQLVAQSIFSITKHQKVFYFYREIPEIQQFILNDPVLTDEECWQKSCILEPREKK
eukprot:TRINITY_DN1598_c1_g1_i1.p1 TRINITY_DN1598_c1_g1~~TRINITY_DN1598_c1_g1_i1.p1  ORF type:complete len:860 (-),score=265.57 TRINITY_DN1598_c1_g1_i1:124-2703(-)